MKYSLIAILVIAASCGDNQPNSPQDSMPQDSMTIDSIKPPVTVIDTLHPQPKTDSGGEKSSSLPPRGIPERGRGISERETRVIAISNSDNQPHTPTDLEVIRESPAPLQPAQTIDVGNVRPAELLRFAKTLQGVPYKYGSTDPAVGFDCSGFITYVFNHFNIRVPRSSVDFTNVGKKVPREDSKPGDLVLFTGTDSSIRVVGHMGIITENDNGALQFIHSTSGKAYAVTITPLNSYYDGRFVKVIRIFPS